MPAELAGSWYASGREGKFRWMVRLELQNGRFERTGYPRWEEHATVIRIEREGLTVRLQLTGHVRNGTEMPDDVLILELSGDGQRLRMGGLELTRGK